MLEENQLSAPKFIRVPKMNIVKAYDDILEISSQNDKIFEIVQSLLAMANRNLLEKKRFMKKKWFHLKSSNLTEKEYRLKEKSLRNSEDSEINEIKEDLFTKLSEAAVIGLETKPQLLINLVAKMEPSKEGPVPNFQLEERSYLNYRKSQYQLIDRLLSSDYFIQNRNLNDKEAENPQKKYWSFNSRHNNVGADQYSKREKKAINVKLSRYLRSDLISIAKEAVDTKQQLSSMNESEFYSVGINELEKFIKTKSDKTYYDPKLIEKGYKHTKEYLLELLGKGELRKEDLSKEDLQKLIDACSFSLNGVHYQQKFSKTKNMVHPLDMLFMLSKIR